MPAAPPTWRVSHPVCRGSGRCSRAEPAGARRRSLARLATIERRRRGGDRRDARYRPASLQRPRRELPAIDALEAHVIDPSDEQSATAVLDKISGAVLIGARQRQARAQLLAGIVEQLLVDSKRARDTEAAAMNMQLVDVARRASRERGLRRRRGRRPADLAAAVATGGAMRPQPSLNLLPTVQQAIANLLTTYEPEFLRVRLQAVPGVRDHRDLPGRASG